MNPPHTKPTAYTDITRPPYHTIMSMSPLTPRTSERSPAAGSPPTAPGPYAAATIVCFCTMLHRRHRSGPTRTSTLAIAPSLALVQTPVFAPQRNHGTSNRRVKDGPPRRGTVVRRVIVLMPLMGV